MIYSFNRDEILIKHEWVLLCNLWELNTRKQEVIMGQYTTPGKNHKVFEKPKSYPFPLKLSPEIHSYTLISYILGTLSESL